MRYNIFHLEELSLLAQVVRLLPGGASRVGQLVVPLVPVRRLVPADGTLAVGRHRAGCCSMYVVYIKHGFAIMLRIFMPYNTHGVKAG